MSTIYLLAKQQMGISYYISSKAHDDHTWWCLNRSCWLGNSADRSHDWVRKGTVRHKGLVDASWSSTFLLELLLLPFELLVIFLHVCCIKLWDGVTRFDDWRGALYWWRRRGLRLWQQGQVWSQQLFILNFLRYSEPGFFWTFRKNLKAKKTQD